MEVLNRQAEIQRKREEEAAKSQMEKEKQLLAKSSAADKGIWRPSKSRQSFSLTMGVLSCFFI